MLKDLHATILFGRNQVFYFKRIPITFWTSQIAINIWSSLIYNTSTRHEWHECNMSATQATRMQHECNTSDTNATRKPHECHTSATQVRCEYYANDTGVTRALHQQHESNTSENITTQVKTYFHTPIFTIRQVKDYKERKNFILRIAFWKCLVLMPKCFLKVYDKNWTF